MPAEVQTLLVIDIPNKKTCTWPSCLRRLANATRLVSSIPDGHILYPCPPTKQRRTGIHIMCVSCFASRYWQPHACDRGCERMVGCNLSTAAQYCSFAISRPEFVRHYLTASNKFNFGAFKLKKKKKAKQSQFRHQC